MTPRPPVPPLRPPGDLFGSGPRAATARAAVEGAGDVSPTRTSPAVPAAARALPALDCNHAAAWHHLRALGPFTLQQPSPGWTLWMPEDPARPRFGCAASIMDALVAHGFAALDPAGRAAATARTFPKQARSSR